MGDPLKLREILSDYLIATGIGLSDQYLAVMEYIYRDKSHLTAGEIATMLEKQHPEISWHSRVYTILDILVRAGAVRAVTLDRHNTFYEGNRMSNSHFICMNCGKVVDLDVSESTALDLLVPPDVSVTEVRLKFIGLCETCLKESAREDK